MSNRFYSVTNCPPLTGRLQQRHLLILSFALASAVLAALPAAATEKTDVIATVHKFVDSFNKGDVTQQVAPIKRPTSTNFLRTNGTVLALARGGWMTTTPTPKRMESRMGS